MWYLQMNGIMMDRYDTDERMWCLQMNGIMTDKYDTDEWMNKFDNDGWIW